MGNQVPVLPPLPNQSSYPYNGKILDPLRAVDEEQLKKIHCGFWSESVPDQLRPIILQPERYREAIGIINTVAQTKVRFRYYWILFLIALGLTLFVVLTAFGIPFVVNVSTENDSAYIRLLKYMMGIWTGPFFFLQFLSLVFSERRRIKLELQKAVGQANTLLFEENVLVGAKSNSKLLLVYVTLDSCRLELSALSLNPGLFKKAIQDYSSDYTCCLAKGHFRFEPMSSTGHLEGTLCFCQYVICRISREKFCFFCCKQQPFSGCESRV